MVEFLRIKFPEKVAVFPIHSDPFVVQPVACIDDVYEQVPALRRHIVINVDVVDHAIVRQDFRFVLLDH